MRVGVRDKIGTKVTRGEDTEREPIIAWAWGPVAELVWLVRSHVYGSPHGQWQRRTGR